MFNRLHILSILIFLYASCCHSQDDIHKLHFLLGKWEINNYTLSDDDWTELGKTYSNIESIFDGKFLTEKVNYLLVSGEIEMKIHIGYDYRKNSLKMCAMDKEFGVMDIYYGEWEDNKLVFTNLESDLPIELPKDKKLHFKVTYSEIKDGSFIHTVEGTYDFGKSWFPFAKSAYTKTF